VEGKSLALFVFLVEVEIVSSGALMRDPILLGDVSTRFVGTWKTFI
jgi:hypothetical protein